MPLEEGGLEWLYELLQDVQLEQFFTRFRDDLQITRLSHFDYVQSDDLEKIGLGMSLNFKNKKSHEINFKKIFLGKPGIRRLLDAVKKRKTQQWRKSIINKIIPLSDAKKSSDKKNKKNVTEEMVQHSMSCLINEKDLT